VSSTAVLSLGLVVQAGGDVILAYADTPLLQYGAAITYGLGWGLAYVAGTVVLLDYFGRGTGSRILSVVWLMTTVAAAGPVGAGAIADRNLEIAEALWAKRMDDPAVEFENGPYKGRVLQRIAPAPFTPGHARLMPVAMKEASARRAATNGWPAFIPAFTPPNIGGREPFVHVRKFFTIYHDMLRDAGHDDATVADALSWTTHTYQCVHVADTDAQAREELEVILRAYQAAIEREAAFNARAEKDDANRKSETTPNALSEDWIGTWCLYGSPETVAAHLEPYAALGIGNILCGTVTGPLTEERLRFGNQTLRLLSQKVLPRFKGPSRAPLAA